MRTFKQAVVSLRQSFNRNPEITWPMLCLAMLMLGFMLGYFFKEI